jgi:hypothetical protein
MLYVLSSDQGELYSYTPGEDADSFSVGTTGGFLGEGPMDGRTPEDIIIVFSQPSHAYQFIHHYSLPGEEVPSRVFNPRPARKEDNLGSNVCLATPQGTQDKFVFAIQSTPPDVLDGN